MDQLAKPGHGVFLALHQRGTGKADITGIWEHRAHFSGKQAIIGAVAFIHQQEHIPRKVSVLQLFGGVELVDNGGDHIRLAAAQQLYQMPPAGGPCRTEAGMGKCGCDLPVQIFTIGDNNHLRVTIRQLHQEILRQHYHGQAFAAALRVPDNAALPVALFIGLRNGPDDLLDGEILLIPADFFHVGVKEHKVADQLHGPFPAEQGDQVSVLLGGHAAGYVPGQRILQKGGVLLLPHVPELFSGACGGIFDGVFVGRYHNLRELIELGDTLLLLVAHILLHGLLHADLRGFAFDDRKGDAVNEQYDIRPGIM